MNGSVLNPDKYLATIKELEKEVKHTDSKVKEQEKIVADSKKENKRLLIGILTVLMFLGLVAFAIVYEPMRTYFLNLLKIDMANFALDKSDFWKVIGLGVLVIMLEAAIVSIFQREKFFYTLGTMLLTGVFSAGVFIIPSGIYFLFLDMSVNNDKKKKAKKELEGLKRTFSLKQQRLNSEKRMQAIEAEKLAQTEDMFRRGIDGDIQLVIESAKLGNPNAIKYIEDKEKNERLSQGRKLYQESKKSSPIDMKLLEEAAKLGDPDAIFEIAEYLFGQTDTDLLTNSEKRKLEGKADKYLKNGDFKNHPDARVLQINRLMETSKEVDYYGLLSEVRELGRKGKLSEKYAAMADDIIRTLVHHFDYEEGDTKINAASFNIDNPAEFMKSAQAIMDKQLGIDRSSAPDGAFVPRIDVTGM